MSQSKPGLVRQTALHNLRERKTVVEEEKPIPTPLLLKPAPIRELCNYQAIYKAINTRIKEQDGAIYKISFIVDDVFRGKQPPEGQGKPFIFKFCIAGPSGCGKTEMVNCIQYILGMESGYEFEHQFISIDGSVMQDIQQVNAITGAAPGLVGHDEEKSLAHRLNKAKKLYIGPKLRSILAKKDTKHAEYKRELAEYASGEIEMPPYMFVFIDELDKADPAFMRAINGFLDTGDYCTPDGSEHFRLGKEMHLLIVFTANYGEDMIMQMNSRNQLQAEQYIVHAMKEHGLANNNIGRIGDFFAFFPLKREALKNIIVDKLVNFIQNTAIAKEYGSDRIFYADEVKELLVGKILDLTDRDRGVRHGLRLLFNNLNTLFKKSLDALQKMLQQNNKLLDDDNNRIELKANEFDMRLFNESIEREFKAFEKDIVLALLDDPEFLDKVKERNGTKKNEQELCAYSNNSNNNSSDQMIVAKSDDSKMGSMSMFIGKNHLASCGLDMNITINNTTNIFFNSADTARKLREENKELKETLSKIVDIAEEKDKSPDRLLRKIKKATNEVKGLLIEEEDEEDEPRVRELTEKEYQHEEEEVRKKKEVPLKTNKKNRKHKKPLIKTSVEETDSTKKRRKEDQSEIREKQKKRKVVNGKEKEEEEEEQSSDTENGSSASLTTDEDDNGAILQRKGRPRKHIDGFEYYDKIAHNPRYKCTFCHTIIYATRVSLHQCQ
jgi:hypothetical protein